MVKILRNWQILTVFFLALIMAVFYSYLGFAIKGDLHSQSGQKLVFNSPDETANYFFSYLYAKESKLSYPESENYFVDGLIAPRSMQFINGQVVPTSFYGLMVILGALAKVFSHNFLVFFIPLITAGSLIYFYLLIKKIFPSEVALVATILAAIFPAYWYYSTRSFYNNVVFVDFFIIGLYYLLLSLEKNKLLYYLASGLFLGWAVFVRTSEAIWLGTLIIIILILNLKKIKIINGLFFILIIIFTWLPIFYFNKLIYGQIFSFGYNYNLLTSTEEIIKGNYSIIKQLVLPFDFNWGNIKLNFSNYFLKLYWWYFILAELGLAFLLSQAPPFKLTEKKLLSKKIIFYLIAFIFISSYLIIFYGSWLFADNPDPQAVTIGTSYNRYFLPIYLFSLPFIGYLIFYLFQQVKILKIFLYSLIIAGFFYFSFKIVYLDNQEGIFKIESNLKDYQEIAGEVLALTDPQAVIIAERNDKIFFPARRVIYKLNNDKDYNLLGNLVNQIPVYWWRFVLTDTDLKYFNKQQEEKGFNWRLQSSIYCRHNQCLYPLTILPDAQNNL